MKHNRLNFTERLDLSMLNENSEHIVVIDHEICKEGTSPLPVLAVIICI